MKAPAIALILLLLTAFCLPPAGFAAADDGQLLKIVALSRHGVRAPTQHKKVLESWSRKTWPDWAVARGDLTPRGARLITAMWQNMRLKLQNYGLIPANGKLAQNDIYVRADVDERTKATARALLDGLSPDVLLGFAVESGKVDPLFHPVRAGLYRYDLIPVVNDVLKMTNGGLEDLQEDFDGALQLMDRIAGSPAAELCLTFVGQNDCEISDLPNAVSVSPDGESINIVGSLGVTSDMAEIFLLEYGNWPDRDAGWGMVNATTLSQLLPVHSKIFDVINRAPIIAWANGSSLLQEMKAALFNEHYDKRCNEAKMVIFVGHDTNLANIGSLLGISWQAKGYPENGIPPGGVLFLELWEKQGKQTIVARFFAQQPKALHTPFIEGQNSAAINMADHAPSEAVVSMPPVVGQARFGTEEFIERVDSVTAGAPIAKNQFPPLNFNTEFAK